MKIKQILDKSCIIARLATNTKEGVIDELAALL